MHFATPFKLGPFSVDAEGGLTVQEPEAGPSFHFRWHGRLIHARLDRTGPPVGSLSVWVVLARVRSTAGAPGSANVRPRSFALLRWLRGVLPPAWRATLRADHRFWLETETHVDVPVTAVTLVTALTGLALDLSPYFELMDDMGLTVSEVSDR